jgi:hypothetical protein
MTVEVTTLAGTQPGRMKTWATMMAIKKKMKMTKEEQEWAVAEFADLMRITRLQGRAHYGAGDRQAP